MNDFYSFHRLGCHSFALGPFLNFRCVAPVEFRVFIPISSQKHPIYIAFLFGNEESHKMEFLIFGQNVAVQVQADWPNTIYIFCILLRRRVSNGCQIFAITVVQFNWHWHFALCSVKFPQKSSGHVTCSWLPWWNTFPPVIHISNQPKINIS